MSQREWPSWRPSFLRFIRFRRSPSTMCTLVAILLCTLFCLLAIDAWFRDRLWVAARWFALAVLSKEECVTVPLVLALYSASRGELGPTLKMQLLQFKTD